jgi:hypothetical protein
MLGVGSLALLSQACTSYASYRFTPPLQDIELKSADGASSVARVLVSARGIGEEQREGQGFYTLCFRVRVENRSGAELALAAEELELVDARLTTIGPARVEPAAQAVPPGGSALYELAFPFPPGREPDEFDLSGIQLKIALRSGEDLWTWSAGFQLLPPEYYYHDPYWGGPWYGWSVGVGVVWCD